MSVTAWEMLGIGATDDARSIKRAYAARLKSARPEDDAEAFQQLTEAFEWALASARALSDARANVGEPGIERTACLHAGSAGAHEDGDAAALPVLGRPMDPIDDANPAGADVEDADETPGFDFGHFFSEMAPLLSERDPRHLRDWLERHEALYSIDLKWALIPYVFDAVARHAAEFDPHRGHLEVLQTFYGVDATLRRHPAIAPAIDYLESRAWHGTPEEQAQREARAAQDAAFERFVATHRAGSAPAFERLLLREWMDAPNALRRLLVLAMPMFPTRLFELFARMQGACGNTAVERVQADAMAFWSTIADRDRLTRNRLALMFARVPLYAVPVVAFVNLLAGSDRLLADVANIVPGLWIICLAWMAGTLGLRRLVAWNARTLQLDTALVTTGAFFIASGAFVLAGIGFGYGLLLGTLVSWIRVRAPALTVFTLVAAACSFALITSGLEPWTPAGPETRLAIAGYVTVAAVVATDVVTGRLRQLPMLEARQRWDSPLWLCMAALLVCLLLRGAGVMANG